MYCIHTVSIANLTCWIMTSCWLHSLYFYSVNHYNKLFHLSFCKLIEASTQTFAWNLPSTHPNQTYLMAEVFFAASVVNLCTSASCLEVKMCKYLTLRLLPAEPDPGISEMPVQCCLYATPESCRCSSRLINSDLRQMEEAMGTNSEPMQIVLL